MPLHRSYTTHWGTIAGCFVGHNYTALSEVQSDVARLSLNIRYSQTACLVLSQKALPRMVMGCGLTPQVSLSLGQSSAIANLSIFPRRCRNVVSDILGLALSAKHGLSC